MIISILIVQWTQFCFNSPGISIYRLGFNLNYKGFDDYLLAKARGECA